MLQRRDGPRFFLWNAFVGILGVLIGRWSDRPALAPVCPRPAADTTLPATPLLSAVEAQGEHGGKRSLLVVARPLRNILLDNEGKLMLAAKRVAIDVGTSVKAPTSRHFLSEGGDDIHVFGIEANAYSAATVDLFSDPHYSNNYTDAFKTFGGFVDSQKVRRFYGSLRDRHKQYTMIHAAASETPRFAELRFGNYKNVGTGGFFRFKKGSKNARNLPPSTEVGGGFVPVITVGSLISLVRDDTVIEVLKIDAQNVDAEVVRGCGDHVARIKCIIGEFGESGVGGQGYDMTRKVVPATNFLTAHGFVRHQVLRNPYEQLWLNTKLRERFARGGKNFCFNSEIYAKNRHRPLDNADLLRTIDAALANG